MILRIGICDDTQTDIIHLEKHIKHYMASYNIEFEIESFRSGAALLQAQKEQPFHILLLDIELPEINGMMVARYLRDELYDDVFIVFVTSYPQYMQESFDVQPFQFLTKPVSYTKIEKLLSDIIRRYKHSHITKIVIDSHGKEHLIPVNNILYIQAVKGEKRYLKYHLIDAILTGEGTIQAAMAAFRVCEGFVYAFFGGLSNATSVVIGQSVGAGDHKGAYRFMKRSALFCPAVTFGIVLICALLHEPLFGLFGLGDQALRYGMYMLYIYLFFGAVRTCNYIMNEGYRAAGETRVGTYVEIGGLFLVSVPATWIAGMVLHLPFLAVFSFVYTDELVRLAIELVYTRSGKWVKPVTEAGRKTLPEFKDWLKNRNNRKRNATSIKNN